MPKVKPIVVTVAILLGLTIALSACGRKGDLDPPSVALKNGDKLGRQGQKAPPQPDKPFILDPLL